MNCSSPGSFVHRILQARILEWVTMPTSRGSSQSRDPTHIFCGSCIAGRFFTAEPLGKTQIILTAAAAKSLQSCLTVRPHRWQPTRLHCPWDSPGKNTGVGCHFLLQCMKVKVKSLSRVQLSATPWTAAYQVPPSMGFSRQEYWSGVPLPSPNSY